MTASLVIFGILGLASTAVAFVVNRHLFAGGTVPDGPPLEAVYYAVGLARWASGGTSTSATPTSMATPTTGNYTKMLFTNWAADSAAQDYIIVNVVLMPLWTIVEGPGGACVGPGSLRDEPLHEPGLLHRPVPGLHGAPAPLQPGGRRRRARRSRSCTRG